MFQATKTLHYSHLKSSCYLLRRLAQAYNSLLTQNPRPNDQQWYQNDWTLLIYCLSEPKLRHKLDPNLKLRRTSIPLSLKNTKLSVELNSNYQTGKWEPNNKLLKRQIYHHFPTNSHIITQRAIYNIRLISY